MFVNPPLLKIDIPGDSCQGITATDVDAEGEHRKGLVASSARLAEANKHRPDKINPPPKPETCGAHSKKKKELQVKDTRIAKGYCKEGHVARSQYEGLHMKPEQLK